AITASPVAAATAAMIGLFASNNLSWGLPHILMICVPSTLCGVIVAALVQMRVGRELVEDPEYQARLAAGEVQPAHAKPARGEAPKLPPTAKTSALIFLAG